MNKPVVGNGFLALDHDFIRSAAMIALSANGKALILAIADRFNGRNNGAIPYGVADATAWLHCSKSTALRTFREIEAAGLIECVERGSFVNKAGARKGVTSRWRLTFINQNRSSKIQTTGSVVTPDWFSHDT